MVDAWTHTKSVTYVYFKYLLFQPLHIGFKGQINEVDDMKLLQNPCNQRKLWIKKYLKNLLLFSWSSMNSVDTRLLHSFICLFLFVFFFKINKSLTTSSSVSLNLLSAWSLVSWGLSLGKKNSHGIISGEHSGWLTIRCPVHAILLWFSLIGEPNDGVLVRHLLYTDFRMLKYSGTFGISAIFNNLISPQSLRYFLLKLPLLDNYGVHCVRCSYPLHETNNE